MSLHALRKIEALLSNTKLPVVDEIHIDHQVLFHDVFDFKNAYIE